MISIKDSVLFLATYLNYNVFCRFDWFDYIAKNNIDFYRNSKGLPTLKTLVPCKYVLVLYYNAGLVTRPDGQ